MEYILKPILQVNGNRSKAVTGVAGYDYDPRCYRSIPKAGPVSNLQTHQSSSISRNWP